MTHTEEKEGKLSHHSHPPISECVINCLTNVNSTALRKAKIVYNFGLSECSRVEVNRYTFRGSHSTIFSSPGRSPGRASVLPQMSASALALTKGSSFYV